MSNILLLAANGKLPMGQNPSQLVPICLSGMIFASEGGGRGSLASLASLAAKSG